jgi:hypothetical protein
VSYIRFDGGGESLSGKTRVWLVMSKSQDARLGRIAWDGKWRQYVFEPDMGTIWSHDCLEDVRQFLKNANDEHKRKGQP